MPILSSDTEWIAYLVLGLIGFVGNSILLLGTWKYLAQRQRTSCMLLLNTALIHLTRILVVNLLSIVSIAGNVEIFNTAGCKIITFTSTFTDMLAIWFTLFVALFYVIRLNRVVHPLTATPSVNRNAVLCFVMAVLWATAVGVSCPLLFFVEKGESLHNVTDNRNWTHVACQVKYSNSEVQLLYGVVVLTVVDVLPLTVLFLVCVRIVLLLREYRVASYGDIWIGEDKSESEVFMASKLVLPLMFLVCGLWVSHYTLLQFLDKLGSYYFFPVLLAILSSAYSALSPFIFIAMSYKTRTVLRPLCFLKLNKAKEQLATVLRSPYAE
ncbi:QRFP-like peptide receptor [Lepisosteus oculatus]|uniref:QRFP-like peptide receptor n=1 Tax=Lepisosteus oculatus TaxID=7918 RepID=UPI00074027DF|nr:PREDICTED: histamine H2 receptor-like [Lepisosteus oculatus]